MNKDDKIKLLTEKLEYYKQFIILLNGNQAIESIERQWNIDKTNKVLTIQTPEDFNTALLEKAILNRI